MAASLSQEHRSIAGDGSGGSWPQIVRCGAATDTVDLPRKLAAVLAADVAGYSTMLEQDEEGSYRVVAARFADIVSPAIRRFDGRVVKCNGDGLIAEFPSAIAAVRCAIELQAALQKANAGTLLPVHFRVGVHIGDAIVAGNDLHGTCINVACRLQALASPDGVCISAAVHEHVRHSIPFHFRSLGRPFLRNISDRLEVFSFAPTENEQDVRTSPSSIVAGLVPRRPILLIHPLRPPDKTPAACQLAEDLTRGLTDQLGRYRWFHVVRASTHAGVRSHLSHPAVNASLVRVAYELQGEVQLLPGKPAVTVRVVDALMGFQCWSGLFKARRSPGPAPVWDTELILRAAAAIEAELRETELYRAIERQADIPDLYDHTQRGWWHYYRRSSDSNAIALAHFQESRGLAKSYADAIVGEASALFWASYQRWTSSPEASLRQAFELAIRAVKLAPGLPRARLILAQSLLFLGRHEAAISEARRAAALNPSNPAILALLGHAYTGAGQFARATTTVRKALLLAPNHGNRFMWLSNLALAHYHLGRYTQASAEALEAASLAPDYWLANQVLIATLARLGQKQNAAFYVSRSRALLPYATADDLAGNLPYHNSDYSRSIAHDLRAAGWDG